VEYAYTGDGGHAICMSDAKAVEMKAAIGGK
jgi:hypothetical protein